MKRYIVMAAILLTGSLGLFGATGTAHAAPAHPHRALACNWDLVASAGPFFFNGTGYENIKTYVKLYGCYITGGGFGGEVYAFMQGYTGQTGECNYAFSARVEGNNGAFHYNPAGTLSTSGCYDGNDDADDKVFVSSPIEQTSGSTCQYDGSGYVSAFFNETYANSGPFCP